MLAAAMILAGCIVPLPVPVPVQVPQGIGPEVTIEGNSPPALMASAPNMTTIGETAAPTVSETPVETPVPVLTPVFPNPLPMKKAYFYADNQGFHSLSVSIVSTQMRTSFYYTPGGNGNPLTKVDAIPGYKFLMVGVNFYMTGILKEGKSSIFMTPLANSFTLLKDGATYNVLNASDIPDMTDYYIHDVGSMYRDQFIDKNDDGSGVLIYVVPQSTSPSGAYVTFCPKNLDSWQSDGYYRSPDDWDCGRDVVVWILT